MDGDTLDVGSVVALKGCKTAIKVAKGVLTHSTHSMLAGAGATDFAEMLGYTLESLETPASQNAYNNWINNNCQPNFFRNFVDQSTSCPPYAPVPGSIETVPAVREVNQDIGEENHDTIGMVVLSAEGSVAAGTTTNGANHKVAGRVGDSALTGSGAFADSTIGGAAGTGDGDVMLRFVPAYQVVENMRMGMTPSEACAVRLHDPSFL